MQFVVEFEPKMNAAGEFTTQGSNIATLFEVTKKGRKKYKTVTLSKKTSIKNKTAVICFLLAQGESLSELCSKNEWCPSTTEFFIWLRDDGVLKDWYKQALNVRNHLVIDKVYARLDKIDCQESKALDSVRDCLNKIKTSISEKDDLTDAPVIYSPVLKDMKEHYKNDN